MVLKKEIKEDLLTWWDAILKNNGARAQLKRCATPAEVALTSETFKVRRIIPSWVSVEAIATITGLLSHVKKEGLRESASFGEQLATKKNNREVFSEMRFRQLLKSKTWDELYTHLRRAIIILNGKVHPSALVEVIVRWDHEMRSGFQSEPGKSLAFVLSNDYYLAHTK